MKKILFLSAACVVALPGWGEEKRELSAHVHGHGGLNIAIEGNRIALSLEVPGFDIVGFEHVAESDTDKAAIEAAFQTLEDPSNLFALKGAGNCEVVEVSVELLNEDDQGDGASHSEFHADFLMNCSNMGALASIELPYFTQFPNAEELDIQLITENGSALIEVTPESPVLDIGASM